MTAEIHPPAAPARDPDERDGGIRLFVLFTAATLTMVPVVVLVGSIHHFWILAPVLVVDAALTFGVMSAIRRLLRDGESAD